MAIVIIRYFSGLPSPRNFLKPVPFIVTSPCREKWQFCLIIIRAVQNFEGGRVRAAQEKRRRRIEPTTQTSSTNDQVFPSKLLQACTATRKLAAPRQDTIPCDLRTQTSSTSDQVFPCPNCSKPCRSRIGLYSHQQACRTQTGHSPL